MGSSPELGLRAEAARGARLSDAKQRRGGAGRREASGGGACHQSAFSPFPPSLLLASLLIPGRPDRNSCRGREGGAPGLGTTVRPRFPIAVPERARPEEEAKVCALSGARSAVLFANFAPLPRRPGLGRGRALTAGAPGAASARARLDGHARGPEPGRGATGSSSSSPCPGAAALSGAGIPRAPPCSTRARACGWCCR